MAEYIVASRSTSWPEQVRTVITAQRLVDELASRGDAPLFNARPALIAYVAGHVDAQEGTPDEVLADSLSAIAAKLVEESWHDVARMLLTMRSDNRVKLRKLAETQLGWVMPGSLRDMFEACFPSEPKVGRLGRLLASLCEADLPLRLLPPYGRLVRSWIETDGRLAFAVQDNQLVLLPGIQRALSFMSDRAASIPYPARQAASAAVLKVLVNHGLGIRHDARGVLRAPCTRDEMLAIPAIAAMANALDLAELMKSGKPSQHVQALFNNESSLGWWLIKALRLMDAHVYFSTPHILRNHGLTAAMAAAMTRAAADAVVARTGGTIIKMNDCSLFFASRSYLAQPSTEWLGSKDSRGETRAASNTKAGRVRTTPSPPPANRTITQQRDHGGDAIQTQQIRLRGGGGQTSTGSDSGGARDGSTTVSTIGCRHP